jgi:hypothetical protein
MHAIPAGTIVHFDDSLIASSPGTWDMFSIDPALLARLAWQVVLM